MKNKKVLILSIVFIVLVAAIILGTLYFTTDIFKTNQQLFYKYIAKTEIIDPNFIKQFETSNKRILKNSNSSLTNFDISSSIMNKETGIADVQKLLTVKSNGLKNVLSKQSYRDFTFSSNQQSFLTLKYIRDDNTFALGADNILAKYLAVENANLKDLFTKLGIQDVSQVPDSISPTLYEEIFKIDEATLEQLKQTYGTLIYNNISKENFYKTKNQDKIETIGVSLTEQEVVNILKLFLETAKNDTTLLNLIITKAQMLNYNNITVESIQTELQSIIDEIDNDTYSTEKDFVKISLIKKDKNVIKLQIENRQELSIYKKQEAIKNNTTNEITPESFDTNVQWETDINRYILDMDFSELNKIIFSIKENDIELIKMTFNYAYDNTNININTEIFTTVAEESSFINLQYQINNYQSDNKTQNAIINISDNEEKSYQINLSNSITLKQDVQISKLTTENSAKLNDMTSEQLIELFTAIGNRINQLYGENLNTLYSTRILQNAQTAQQHEKNMQAENRIIQNYQNMKN